MSPDRGAPMPAFMRSARWQIFSLTRITIRTESLRGLNALTPRDITVKAVEIVADSFDARRDGRSRVYEYRILNRSTPSPFYRNRAWHIHEPLDVEAMAKAIECLIGEHDFSSFRAANCDAPHPVRTIYQTPFRTARRAAGLHHRRHGVSCATWCATSSARSPKSAVAFVRRNRSPICSQHVTAPRPVTPRRRMDCIW